jgi:hypothetical protein
MTDMTITVTSNYKTGSNYVLAISSVSTTLLDGLTVINGGAGTPVSGYFLKRAGSTHGFATVVVSDTKYSALVGQLPGAVITIGVTGDTVTTFNSVNSVSAAVSPPPS